MVEGTRSQDFRRLEEFVREILNKVNRQETNIIALGMQHNNVIAQFQQEAEQNGVRANQQHSESISSVGSNHNKHSESISSVGSNHNKGNYLFTRQSKVEFPRFAREDLNGWMFRCR
ncbi:hypothetical protein DITRI_Ditri01bG0119400 [Diplodiscus trichospermus]